MGTVRIAAAARRRVCDGRRPPAGPPRQPTGRRGTHVLGSFLVLDLVFVVGVLALFALVGAVAAGVERL
jgi:hypothetical protein